MKKVIKDCEEIEEKLCIDNVSEDMFYTLETKSGRPFFLVRANAEVNEEVEEDQYHWMALGAEKNRKTGVPSFEEAIERAFKKSDFVLKEHETQKEAFLYLAELAGAYEDE